MSFLIKITFLQFDLQNKITFENDIENQKSYEIFWNNFFLSEKKTNYSGPLRIHLITWT